MTFCRRCNWTNHNSSIITRKWTFHGFPQVQWYGYLVFSKRFFVNCVQKALIFVRTVSQSSNITTNIHYNHVYVCSGLWTPHQDNYTSWRGIKSGIQWQWQWTQVIQIFKLKQAAMSCRLQGWPLHLCTPH